MAYTDFKKPFRLHTDASILGLGGVLYQEQDGVEKVISYTSWSLLKAESKYPVHKLEFLCLKWAITDQFHKYLYRNTFDIYIDNNPLTYVLSTAKLGAMGHRWIAPPPAPFPVVGVSESSPVPVLVTAESNPDEGNSNNFENHQNEDF